MIAFVVLAVAIGIIVMLVQLSDGPPSQPDVGLGRALGY